MIALRRYASLDTFRLLKDRRAWLEINISALQHNAEVLQALLPSECKLMAVVKANAYGHGDIEVAKALNNSSVDAFAVATLSEGIRLRKNGIKGEILILGYTNPCDITYLARYRLTQTVVDYDYAKVLNECNKKVKVHIKIDTGMHRLGLDYSNFSEIESIFSLNKLIIGGLFSHLCVSDSLKDKDASFTRLQIKRFFEIVANLQSKGYSTGKLHIQSSYGILNYPNLPCDYARAGVALYGILSNNNKTQTDVSLQPVLSLKARIAVVKQIDSGESVGYGRQFTADTTIKIATVTIGYADGIPRNLFDKGSSAYVLIHSQKAPIIGQICMDQFIIDVTNIEKVNQNDVVTIIGMDGSEQIRCEDFAERCGTITNEILSRFGHRLNIIITT